MAIHRELWPQTFIAWPSFRCPTCSVGVLKYDPKRATVEETVNSKRAHGHEAWEPEWIRKRFSAPLICSNPTCSDLVIVCGTVGVEWDWYYDEDGGTQQSYDEVFEPHYFEPSLDFFPIPQECPESVSGEIRKAFSLIWSDAPSAGNKLRVALEALLDAHKVPKRGKISKGKNKGKMNPLNLHRRIERFAVKKEKAAEQLMAIKWLGNSGSHSTMSDLIFEDVLDAFEHFEYALDLIYMRTSERLERRAQKIDRIKGPIRAKRRRRRKRM